MSLTIDTNQRTMRHNLKWPLPRRLSISLFTLAALLAIWSLIAYFGLISPLFLPPPGQVLQQLITIAGPQGFKDTTHKLHMILLLMFHDLKLRNVAVHSFRRH